MIVLGDTLVLSEGVSPEESPVAAFSLSPSGFYIPPSQFWLAFF